MPSIHNNSDLPLLCQLLIHPVSQTISLCFVSDSHFPLLSSLSANSNRTLLCCHLYLPWVRATWRPDRMCAMAPLFKNGLQFGHCLVPTVASLQEMGVSYIDLSGNEILNWSFLPNSVQVNSRSGKFHFIQAPCLPSSDALAFRWSSCVLLTSAWTLVRLSVADAFDHCWKCDISTPCRPVLVFSMISRKFSILSAWSTDVFAYYFLPFLVWNSALAILSSAEFLNVITCRHSNSSTTEETGMHNWVELL